MLRQEIDYNKIVSVLKNTQAISDITTEITFWEPVTEPNEIQVILTQITDKPYEDVFIARVEFRLIWKDQDTTFTELKNLAIELKNVLLNTIEFDWFKCRKIYQGSASPNMRWENNIPIFALDFIFEYDYFL